MNAKHTPGPWRVAGHVYVTDASDRNLARVFPLATSNLKAQGEAEKTAQADTRLIAAAPDLLAALRATLATFRSCIGHAAFAEFERDNNAVIAARAAIAKATGGAL